MPKFPSNTVRNLGFILDCHVAMIEHVSTIYIGRLARMSVLDTEVDGSNPGNSMLFP